MARDYNTNIDQMKAISWQLKRIADQLETFNERTLPKYTSTNQELNRLDEVHYQIYESIIDDGKESPLRDFLNSIKE